MAISGSCLCGGVRFEIEKAVGPVEICHCNRCRKTTGSASLPAIGVMTEDYRFLAGHELVKTYEAPILYEPPAYQSMFCSNCGSPVPPVDPVGDWLEIPAGIFDDDPWIKPDKHIFVEFVPPWDEIADSLPQYTIRDLAQARHRELPEDFQVRTHYDSDGDG